MKLIKQIHDLINLATDKGVTDYHAASQIDDAIDQGQQLLFRQLVKDYPKNKRVRNDLLPFEKVASVVITAKVGSIPVDHEQEIEAYYTANGIDYPFTFIESGSFRRRISDVVSPPTATDPIATVNYNAGKKIEVYPQVSPVTFRYWILPPKPFYATITSLTIQIPTYDDVNSVDVLWSRGMHDIVVENTFKILGLNLREAMLAQSGLKQQPKEATI